MQPALKDQIASDVSQLFDAVGRDWIEQHAAAVDEIELANERSGGRRTRMRQFHPLAVSARQYLSSTDVEAAYNSMGDRLIRLAVLAAAIRVLDGVQGLECRVANLVAGDGELYYSSEFELVSAATYVAMGHAVAFVNEGDTPTFDLLVDAKVEVECKQATPVIREDRRDEDAWGILDRRIRSILDRYDGVHFLWVIVPDSPSDHIGEIVDMVSTIVAASPGQLVNASGHIHYHYARGEVRYADREAVGSVPQWFPEQAQHHRRELSAMVEGGQPSALRGGCLAFDSRRPARNPAEVALRQLRRAPRQFSGTAPAVIHVDITSALRRARLGLGDTTVAEDIRSWLQRHPEVSAVNLVAPPAEPTVYQWTFHLERSPMARYPLPTPFLGVS